MPNYSLFIEQTHYTGPATRLGQRTCPIDAAAEDLALKKADGLIDSALLADDTVRQIRAHLCRADGSVLREIIRSRDPEMHGPGSA
jgi:hypothetical protein